MSNVSEERWRGEPIILDDVSIMPCVAFIRIDMFVYIFLYIYIYVCAYVLYVHMRVYRILRTFGSARLYVWQRRTDDERLFDEQLSQRNAQVANAIQQRNRERTTDGDDDDGNDGDVSSLPKRVRSFVDCRLCSLFALMSLYVRLYACVSECGKRERGLCSQNCVSNSCKRSLSTHTCVRVGVPVSLTQYCHCVDILDAQTTSTATLHESSSGRTVPDAHRVCAYGRA